MIDQLNNITNRKTKAIPGGCGGYAYTRPGGKRITYGAGTVHIQRRLEKNECLNVREELNSL